MPHRLCRMSCLSVFYLLPDRTDRAKDLVALERTLTITGEIRSFLLVRCLWFVEWSICATLGSVILKWFKNIIVVRVSSSGM